MATRPEREVQGLLPVCVLQHLIIGWFERVSPDLLDEVKQEISYRGLQGGIGYHIEANVIDDVAWIDTARKINLKEPYLQLLWCTCYALVVMWEKGWTPALVGKQDTVILDDSIPELAQAYKVMQAGINLLCSFDPSPFNDLPGPKSPNQEEDELIEKGNIAFVAAGAFILMHEVGHQYYDHVGVDSNDEQSKKHEFDADAYALGYLKRGMSGHDATDNIHAVGVIAVMTTLMFMSPDFDGGDRHPDLNIRYMKALDSIEVGEREEVWVTACLSLILYQRFHGGVIHFPAAGQFNSYRQVFESMMKQLVSAKRPQN
jgi:hypothetical protein